MRITRSDIKFGQEFRLPFGSSGTQLARVEVISENGRIGIRRFRAKPKKWNKALHWWDASALVETLNKGGR